jgi:hypothetical protein
MRIKWGTTSAIYRFQEIPLFWPIELVRSLETCLNESPDKKTQCAYFGAKDPFYDTVCSMNGQWHFSHSDNTKHHTVQDPSET